ncbi:MAG: SH3 domain-containing protein [Rhizobiaceae bacterium]|nr:SH3 domain-containing protein [Rhizobiaceae bacterium]
MSKKFVLPLVAAATAAIALGSSAPVSAQYCEGTVFGLSANYNPATGSGFLAIRKKPTVNSQKIGELFNGDKVEIFTRQGNWYKIAHGMTEGWSYAKWMHNSCPY